MPMPKQIGVIETMIGIPSPNQPRSYDFMRPLFRDKESIEQFDVPRRVHVQGRAEDRHARGLHQVHARADGPVRHREGGDRRLARQRGDRARGEAAPRPLHSAGPGEPEPGDGGRAPDRARVRGARHLVGGRVPVRPRAAGADQRQAVLSDLREVRGARHRDLLLRGRARPAHPDVPAARRSTSTRCAGTSRSSSSCSATAASRGRISR